LSYNLWVNNPAIPKNKDKGKSLGKWRSECDALMQEIGRLTNPYCILCQRDCQVMHHFIPKSVCARLRYEWSNLVPLCNGCHNRLHQSGDPGYEQRIIKYNGIEWYEKLEEMRKEEIQVNVGYYRDLRDSFKKELNEIKRADISFGD
jgi:hypothetical protein